MLNLLYMLYYPILLSKSGELTALERLDQNVKNDTCPIFEVLSNNLDALETFTINYWCFNDNQVAFDFSVFEDVNGNLKVIKRFLETLLQSGVNAIPVIQENSSPRYIGMIQTLVANYGCDVCIRTSNSSGGFANYNANVNNLMTLVGSTPATTLQLIDLGYAEDHNYNILSGLGIAIIHGIPNLRQWQAIVVASGSFPVDLSHLLPPNHVYRLQRYEWDIWNSIKLVATFKDVVKYGDYGTKNPIYGGEGNFPGSCSIKYTVADEFVIYRGILSRDHPHGNGQYITFAARLITSPDYSGVGFSWGDSEINRIAHETLTNPRRRPGSATTWVQISQNHHVSLIHSLL